MTISNGEKTSNFFLAEMFPREHHTRIKIMQQAALSTVEASGIPASSWGGDNHSGREKHRQKNTKIYKHNGYGNVGVYRQNHDAPGL